MSLLIVGSVAFDSIQTPFGKINKTLGGSGSYFSLASSKFCNTNLVGVVGQDFTEAYRQVLKKQNIDLSGLEQIKGKTFAWGGKYNFDLNSRETLFTHLNVFENFKPKLSASHKTSTYIFLGNIHPALQLEVLSQANKPKFVGLDTMNFWIEKAPKELAKVLNKVNVFVINDSEARELSKEHNLLRAAKKIMKLMGKNSTLIIKRGEFGLLMFQKNVIFHLPGFPLEDVIDPTGAGDSFAGGFMGFLAKTNDTSWANLKRACVAGSVMASFCVEKLGTQKLQKIKSGEIKKRFTEFKKLINF
jgi:sugar/nucleoside kinase (ribokinase family)